MGIVFFYDWRFVNLKIVNLGLFNVQNIFFHII